MSGIRHTTQGAQQHLLESLVVLPQIIETAVLSHVEPDKRRDPNIIGVEKYKATISRNGKKMTVLMTVKHQLDGRRYYDHALIDVKDGINKPAP